MKFTQTDYLGTKNILRFPDHYVAVPVKVSDTDVIANSDGKKIVKAGTIVGGSGGKALTDPETYSVTVQNDADAEGVLFNDVDVTHGARSGAMIIHGFIETSKIPSAPTTEAATALAGRIVFLK
ncbi:hypothetical protein [Sporomusa aerivorans]|uniref:hypothetical protein n=1 Tax=Sporomusa aerivorans TaxID=204936 RepID=UPI00352B938E